MTAQGVSVVIPTHDRPDTCAAAIRSALTQTERPLEVIVVDDHSTEAAAASVRETCEREGAKLVRRTSGPRGPAPARNAGVQAASGPLIAFLDDDDEWLPHKLEKQLPWFELGYELVCSNAIRTSGGSYFEKSGDREIGRTEILVHNPVIFSTAVISRRALMAAAGLDEAPWLVGIEDYELLLRLSDAKVQLAYIDEPLAVYRDESQGRLSDSAGSLASSLARMSLRRSAHRPLDLAQHRATLRIARAARR